MSLHLAGYYSYLVYGSTALGLVVVIYLLALRIARHRRGR